MPRKLQVVLSVVDKATKGIDKVEGKLKRFGAASKRVMKQLINLPSILAGLAVFRLGKSFVDAAAKIDLFRKQLIAVTGSAAEADKKLAAIREFARTSPLETEDVIKSFVKLRAVGIDPTMDQMKTMGGVAVLFGKELEQVLDSFIGLNKRTLRRIGVEIDRTGKKAIIASGTIRREVAKDSATIRKALLEVWAERFPNAIETASGTFVAKMAIMRSNIFEFQAQLTETFLPTLGDAVDSVGEAFAKLIPHINKIAAGILALGLPFRLVWNAIQIGVDTVVAGIMGFGKLTRLVLTAVINGWLSLLETVRVVAENIGTVVARMVQAAAAIWDRDFGKLKEIAKAGWDDIRDTVGEAQDRIQKRSADTSEEWKDAVLTMDAISTLWATRTVKNYNDVDKAVQDFVTLWTTTQKKMEAPELGGTGATGAQVREKENIITLTKAQILALKKKLAANKLYSQLIIDNVRDEYTSKLLKINVAEAEAFARTKAWRDAGVIDAQRAADMHAAIEKRGAVERMELQTLTNTMTIDHAVRLAGGLASVAKMATENSKAEAKKRQNILAGIAVVEASAAAVTGIAAVWRDDSISNVWYKIAMTAVVAAEIIASTAVYISQLNSATFARGTGFAPGGSALVGEEGPELVNVPRGAQVMSAPQTRQQISGVTIAPTIIVQGNADASTVSAMDNSLDRFAKKIREAKRLGYLDSATIR